MNSQQIIMNPNQQLIEEFYAGFASHNANTMASCYHENIVFNDPVFGTLKGQDVSDMWHMLIEKSKSHIKIEFSDVKANDSKGSAKWIATYEYGKSGRKVVNEIEANFEFKDGSIIRHSDNFDIWKWSKQALGLSGRLLGWTGFMQAKIKQGALGSLRKYQSAKREM